jgi:hypothetical protein
MNQALHASTMRSISRAFAGDALFAGPTTFVRFSKIFAISGASGLQVAGSRRRSARPRESRQAGGARRCNARGSFCMSCRPPRETAWSNGHGKGPSALTRCFRPRCAPRRLGADLYRGSSSYYGPRAGRPDLGAFASPISWLLVTGCGWGPCRNRPLDYDQWLRPSEVYEEEGESRERTWHW